MSQSTSTPEPGVHLSDGDEPELGLIPVAYTRPEGFTALRKALFSIGNPESTTLPRPWRWSPHPVDHPTAGETLRKHTQVRTDRGKDDQFTHFCMLERVHTARIFADPRITNAWCRFEKPLREGLAPLLDADGKPASPVMDRNVTRRKWVGDSLLYMHSPDYTGPRLMSSSWMRFYPDDPNPDACADDLLDVDLLTSHWSHVTGWPTWMHIAAGFWWYNEENSLQLEADIWRREEAKNSPSGQVPKNVEAFKKVEARPNRMILLLRDDLLPAYVGEGKLTHSELTYALTYMNYMQASVESALLLITVFGDRGARIVEVFWDEEEEKLVFDMRPMLDLGHKTIEAPGAWEDGRSDAKLDPWRLLRWLACRPCVGPS